jgi:hypothetical protein
VPGGIGTITPVRAPLGSLGVISDNLGEFEISGSLVAYLVDESAAETDLNGDGDMSDLVVQVIDLAADAGTPINTAVAAFPCFLAGCDGLRHYRVDDQRGTISFLVYEPEQGQDLDGDGDALDFVLDVFNLRSRRHHVTKVLDNASTADPSLDIPILPGNLFDGEVLYTRATETDYGVDLNGDGTITGETQVLLSADSDNDGVFDDFDTCVDAANSDEVDVDHDHLGDTRCDPNSAVCGPTPLAGCQPAEPGGSLIALKRGATASHDVFKWAWKGSPTTFADLGDPVAGLAHYSICTYDGSAQAEPVTRTAIVPDRVCNPKRKTACWQRTRSGLKFKDTGGYPEGIRTGTLVPGPRDARMKFAGKGASLRVPGLPLTLPVRTQIVVREGNRQECWEAVYSGASANDGVQFKAKSD